MSVINALADSKAFRTAASEFALHAEVGLDGLMRLHSIHHGRVVPLDDLDHARAFLAQIGGANA